MKIILIQLILCLPFLAGAYLYKVQPNCWWHENNLGNGWTLYKQVETNPVWCLATPNSRIF